MKRRFESEIEQEYPEWYEEWKAEHPDDDDSFSCPVPQPQPKSQVVKRSTPAYVLPIILAILALTAYAVFIYDDVKAHYWNNEDAISIVEQGINSRYSDLSYRVNRNTEALNLMAILYNENFAAIRNATGIQNLIFLQPNWTIDRMPNQLNLSQEQQQLLRDRYLRENQTP